MNILSPVTIDIVACLCVLLSGLLGLVRGFLEEILWLIVLASVISAIIYGFSLIMPLIHYFVPLIWVSSLTTIAIILLISMIILTFMVHVIMKSVHIVHTSVDHSLGFFFGLGRGILVISIAYLLIDSIFYPRPLWLETAQSLLLMQQGAAWIKAVLLTPVEVSY